MTMQIKTCILTLKNADTYYKLEHLFQTQFKVISLYGLKWSFQLQRLSSASSVNKTSEITSE